MKVLLIIAAILVQDGPFEAYGETGGWQIARSGSGCLMTREYGDDGHTILTLSIDPAVPESPLRLLFGNSGWALPAAEDDGYALDFGGGGSTWPGLAAQTFSSENEDGSIDGVISFGFADDVMTPVLEDMAGASGLRLSWQDRTISELRFDGAEAAIRSLGRCVADLP